jgi:prephenate dehydrogenase
MAELSVAILGLGRLGASVGLALKRYNDQPNVGNHFSIIGNDRIGSVERTAKKMGALDDVAATAREAVRDKDLVVLATPYAESHATLRDIVGDLRAGAVILDFSPLKVPSQAWAGDLLAGKAHLVGATAVVNPVYLWDGLDDTEHAQADYFDNGAVIVAPDAVTNGDAIELVTSFTKVLGADVHYMDPVEHDGLVAGTEGIPALLSVATFRALSSSDGWSEAQRVTNPAFGRVTHRIMDTHPDDIRDMLLNNRENVVRYLDEVLASLQGFREVLAEDDQDAVEAALVSAEEKYQAWLKRRSQGKWDEALEQERPEGGSMLSGMLGGFLSDRLFGGRNSKGDDR